MAIQETGHLGGEKVGQRIGEPEMDQGKGKGSETDRRGREPR